MELVVVALIVISAVEISVKLNLQNLILFTFHSFAFSVRCKCRRLQQNYSLESCRKNNWIETNLWLIVFLLQGCCQLPKINRAELNKALQDVQKPVSEIKNYLDECVSQIFH